MKLKTTSWEVYKRDEICVISYWEQWRSGLKSSQSCRENECKALYLLAIPRTQLHLIDYISTLFLRQETRIQTLCQEQVWLRVAPLEEHRAGLKLSSAVAVQYQLKEVVDNCKLSKHFSPHQCHLFSVQPKQLTSAVTETTCLYTFCSHWMVSEWPFLPLSPL